MKVNKESVPQDFNLSLAVVDTIPVLLFGGSTILISLIFNSKLFLVGSLLCLFAGLSKVIWKIIVATKKKNIWFLFIQMRITMPIGLLLMIISFIINKQLINIDVLLINLLSFPVNLFFIIGIIGMIMMLIFALTLDGNKVKNNWMEQITNLIAQLCFFIGLLIIVIR